MDSSIHCGLGYEIFLEFEKLYSGLYINKKQFHLIEKRLVITKNNIRGGITDMTLYYLLQNYKKSLHRI